MIMCTLKGPRWSKGFCPFFLGLQPKIHRCLHDSDSVSILKTISNVIQAEIQAAQVAVHEFFKTRCYFASLLHSNWTEGMYYSCLSAWSALINNTNPFIKRFLITELIVKACHWIIQANATAKSHMFPLKFTSVGRNSASKTVLGEIKLQEC